jgi:hypothetical protein
VRLACLSATLVALLTASAFAQGGFFRRAPGPEYDTDISVPYDGQFVFVRLRYSGGDGFRREPPWHHDYPRAERHFMRILQEVTFLKPHLDDSNIFTLDDRSRAIGP